MTAHHDVPAALHARPHGRRLVWVVLSALAALFCALSMVAKFTTADDMSWFVFALAGFGVIGFGTTAVEQWLGWPRGEEPVWNHWLGTVFWGAFGLYQAYAVVWQIGITDADTNWWVVAIASILTVLMLGWSYQAARKASRR